MNNKNIVTNEAFEELFQVTTMEKLYPGSPEGNMFVLVSSMSESEICEVYAAVIDDYRPFVIIPPEAMEFIKDSEREEWRQERAIQTHEAAFCITRKMSICSLPTSSCLLWK